MAMLQLIKMKDYINLLYSIIDKIHKWENQDNNKKIEILKIYIPDLVNQENYLDYFEKYRKFLSKTLSIISQKI